MVPKQTVSADIKDLCQNNYFCRNKSISAKNYLKKSTQSRPNNLPKHDSAEHYRRPLKSALAAAASSTPHSTEVLFLLLPFQTAQEPSRVRILRQWVRSHRDANVCKFANSGFAPFRVAEEKISASIVDTVLAKVAAEERSDWDKRRLLRRRETEEDLQDRTAVKATSGQQVCPGGCRDAFVAA